MGQRYRCSGPMWEVRNSLVICSGFEPHLRGEFTTRRYTTTHDNAKHFQHAMGPLGADHPFFIRLHNQPGHHVQNRR